MKDGKHKIERDTFILRGIARRFLFFSAFVCLSLALPFSTSAAEIFFEAQAREVAAGSEFSIDVVLNTKNEDINALEGRVLFPRELVEVREIRDGNSIVNLWIERPSTERVVTNDARGGVVFSGITPGGFGDEGGLLFSIIFEAKKEGIAEFSLSNVRALRDDGIGSEVETTTRPFTVEIVLGDPADITERAEKEDRYRPESFVPKVARDETLFDGKWFVVFTAQDKQSGIERYEVRETRGRIQEFIRGWEIAESPYVLADQNLRSVIWVKAIDRAGNERVEKLPPQNPLPWYENYDMWAILFVVILLLLALSAVLKARRRSRKKQTYDE